MESEPCICRQSRCVIQCTCSGRKKYANGDRYEGELLGGKRDGQGTFQQKRVRSSLNFLVLAPRCKFAVQNPNANIFQEFHCDIACLPYPGVLQYSEGGYYTGSWLANKQHGKGRVPPDECLQLLIPAMLTDRLQPLKQQPKPSPFQHRGPIADKPPPLPALQCAPGPRDAHIEWHV